jgi:hypothetical protein
VIERLDVAEGLLQLAEDLPDAVKFGQQVVLVERASSSSICVRTNRRYSEGSLRIFSVSHHLPPSIWVNSRIVTRSGISVTLFMGVSPCLDRADDAGRGHRLASNLCGRLPRNPTGHVKNARSSLRSRSRKFEQDGGCSAAPRLGYTPRRYSRSSAAAPHRARRAPASQKESPMLQRYGDFIGQALLQTEIQRPPLVAIQGAA